MSWRGWHQREVQIAYAIGKAEPLSINVETSGTGIDDDKIAYDYQQVFDLRPRAIIHQLVAEAYL